MEKIQKIAMFYKKMACSRSPSMPPLCSQSCPPGIGQCLISEPASVNAPGPKSALAAAIADFKPGLLKKTDKPDPGPQLQNSGPAQCLYGHWTYLQRVLAILLALGGIYGANEKGQRNAQRSQDTLAFLRDAGADPETCSDGAIKKTQTAPITIDFSKLWQKSTPKA
ncbi:hypothetical protein NEDG_01056 [Nematocida displodere]|uniref:Uncharacterized protein n=1 Tax=Nematocida displodere TaxID=1805483 RepID=A0A177EAF8_9MICR|nr:hypothetical protein NEDG_01056 [Nematocida displodere]